MDIPIDNIVSSSELQKDYKKVFNKAKRSKRPVIVMRGSQPEVAVVDVNIFKDMEKRLEDLEIEETLRAWAEVKRERKEGKLITADSLFDLLKK